MLAVLLTLCLASSAFAMEPVAETRFLSWMFELGMQILEEALGFSLSALWDVVVGIGGAIYAQFVSIITQLVFAGQAVIAQVVPIFSQLVTDVFNHMSEASIYIEAALAQVSNILVGAGKRELTTEEARFIDYMIDLLGLRPVWDTILALGGAIVLQFTQILTQLFFAGQAVVAQVIPIFTQLVSDLTNHVADALPLVTNALAQVTLLLGRK